LSADSTQGGIWEKQRVVVSQKGMNAAAAENRCTELPAAAVHSN
jgi:hypothetical protein